MRLSSFTSQKLVDLSLPAGEKTVVISSMVDLLARSPHVTDRSLFREDVLAREKLVTTGVGDGVAFPHAKSVAISGVVFALGRTTGDVDFGALDGNPVRLIFMIGAPKAQEPSKVYLNVMARLSFLMKDRENRELLLAAGSVDDVFRLLNSVK